MTNSKTITASLEGAQIIVDELHCQLHKYNFVENRWYTQSEARRPLSRAQAEELLALLLPFSVRISHDKMVSAMDVSQQNTELLFLKDNFIEMVFQLGPIEIF